MTERWQIDSPGKCRLVRNKLRGVSLHWLGSSLFSTAQLLRLWGEKVGFTSTEVLIFCAFCTFLLRRGCAEITKAHHGVRPDDTWSLPNRHWLWTNPTKFKSRGLRQRHYRYLFSALNLAEFSSVELSHGSSCLVPYYWGKKCFVTYPVYCFVNSLCRAGWITLTNCLDYAAAWSREALRAEMVKTWKSCSWRNILNLKFHILSKNCNHWIIA